MLVNAKPHGMACPECSHRIIVDISQLLLQGKIICPVCQLELILNQQKSAESIQVLQTFQNEFSEARNHFERAQYTSTESETQLTKRRRVTTRRRRTSRA